MSPLARDNWFTTENGIDRVLGELARCGNQFVGDMKSYLFSITNNWHILIYLTEHVHYFYLLLPRFCDLWLLLGITDTVIDTIVSVTVSAFLCPFFWKQGVFLRQHRTIASADLSGSFAPFLQFQKREIHTVFPRFWNFELAQNLSLSFLAELCGVALNFATHFGLLFPWYRRGGY